MGTGTSIPVPVPEEVKMMGRFRSAWLVVAVSCPCLTGCSDKPVTDPEPDSVVVAVMDGRDISLADFNAYLEANLPEDPEGAASSTPEHAVVTSRLFDRFLEEEMLLAEANRRGIRLEVDEREAYNGLMRRAATVRKLVMEWAGEGLTVTDSQVDALLEERAEGGAGDRGLVLRSLLFEDGAKAASVHGQIRRNRMTFAEAVVAYEQTSGQADPVAVRLGHLPEPVREAVKSLKAGWTSAPTVVQGETYLFLVERWMEAVPADDEATRREARNELQRRRFDRAVVRLLEELRKNVDLRVKDGNLPFEYIQAESNGGG